MSGVGGVSREGWGRLRAVAALPLVALGALAGEGSWLRPLFLLAAAVAPAAVAMETGAAGTGVCEELRRGGEEGEEEEKREEKRVKKKKTVLSASDCDGRLWI